MSRNRTFWGGLLLVAIIGFASQLRENVKSTSSPKAGVGSFHGNEESASLDAVKLRPLDTQGSQLISRARFFDAISIEASAPDRAVILLTQALNADPSFESARERLAMVYLEQGNVVKAAQEASACLNINSKNTACHRVLIEGRLGDGGLDLAHSAIQDCLSAKQDDFFCLKKLREYYLSKNDEAGFERAASRAFSSSTRDQEFEEMLRAQFYEQAGDRARARELYISSCSQGRSEACQALEFMKNKG
jgi:tetratricopeptide (TPR) repeat protein